jgi:hypothetical protein
MQDRQWAVGLTQEQFSIKFQQMNPGTDVIPLGEEWVKGSDPVYNGISGVGPEGYSEDGPVKEKVIPQKVAQPGKFKCRGCDKAFAHAIARAGHERGCKSVIKEAS